MFNHAFRHFFLHTTSSYLQSFRARVHVEERTRRLCMHELGDKLPSIVFALGTQIASFILDKC